MKFQKTISYISIVLNVLYIGLWIYVSNRYLDHATSKAHFNAIFIIPGYYREGILVGLTVFSIFVFGKSTKNIDRFCLVLQILIGFLLIWQFL